MKKKILLFAMMSIIGTSFLFAFNGDNIETEESKFWGSEVNYGPCQFWGERAVVHRYYVLWMCVSETTTIEPCTP